MGLRLDIPIKGRQSADHYVLAELARVGYIRTLNLNKVAIELNDDDSVYRIGFRK
jgi:hypothetical protein